MVPKGDMEIPLITSLIHTVEWLTDYNNFYEKRCHLLHPAPMAALCSKSESISIPYAHSPSPADIWSLLP